MSKKGRNSNTDKGRNSCYSERNIRVLPRGLQRVLKTGTYREVKWQQLKRDRKGRSKKRITCRRTRLTPLGSRIRAPHNRKSFAAYLLYKLPSPKHFQTEQGRNCSVRLPPSGAHTSACQSSGVYFVLIHILARITLHFQNSTSVRSSSLAFQIPVDQGGIAGISRGCCNLKRMASTTIRNSVALAHHLG